MTDMFAGGPGGDPYMGLLGMSDPRVTVSPGLMNPQPQPMGQWSQLAYQMAGSPQAPPYASVPVPTATPGSISSGSGSGGGSGILGGLLGTIARNPKAISQAYNWISGLLGGAPTEASAAAAGAPALAGLGADTAAATGATSADIAASNSAWLASQPAASSALYAGAPAAADAAAPAAAAATDAAPAASSATAGGALAVAAPLALALYASSTAPVDYGAQWTGNLSNAAQQAIGLLNSGAPGAADGVSGLLQSLNGVPGMSGLESQLSSALDAYSNNLMLQRALAAGYPSVDAMNAAANASGNQRSDRGGPTKGTVRV
jgi:hypothetical protein